MSVLKKALIAAAGAAASYYATRAVQKLLEEKSLDARMSAAKDKVVDIKTGVATKVVGAKSRADAKIDDLSKKLDTFIDGLIAEKVEKPSDATKEE